jgi:putative phosphoribosyl transferase
VAYEVARALGAPLDVFLVRKLGVPGHEELAMGAIASGDIQVLNDDVVRQLALSPQTIARVEAVEEEELRRREREYRGARPPVVLAGRTVILVDDGLATGSTMRAAVAAVRQKKPAKVVVAVPVGAPTTCTELRKEADEVVCLLSPWGFHAVGQFYADFSQTTDEEVKALLMSIAQRSVVIPVPGGEIAGDLVVPDEARGLVVFAHGSGSSRHSPRNRQVAETLQQAHLATLLVDLLTLREESQDVRDGRLRFDIPFLARRLQTVTAWAAQDPSLADLDVGYFGASTGGAAALVAAAEAPAVKAVVSRGGRPDLAGDALARVTAPTLLIVGGRDVQVLELNEQARRRMTAPVSLEVIPGATHLFEEPGALARVSELAAGFLARYLGVAAGVRA